MTDEEFTANARQMSAALVEACRRWAVDPSDSAQLIGAACAEAMAALIGHPLAVERLRDIADLAETEVLRAH